MSVSIYFTAEPEEDLRSGVDKSLAWPGRKQATATKLGIFIQRTTHEAQYTS